MSSMRSRLGLLVVVGVGWALLTGASASAAPGGSLWNSAGGDRANTRYAARESRISPSTAADLTKKWELGDRCRPRRPGRPGTLALDARSTDAVAGPRSHIPIRQPEGNVGRDHTDERRQRDGPHLRCFMRTSCPLSLGHLGRCQCVPGGVGRALGAAGDDDRGGDQPEGQQHVVDQAARRDAGVS
jgi:hypothetical protein